MSYKVAVTPVAEQSGPSFNSLRFETKDEADDYGWDLMCRWFGAEGYEIVESDEPVNYTFTNLVLESVGESISS